MPPVSYTPLMESLWRCLRNGRSATRLLHPVYEPTEMSISSTLYVSTVGRLYCFAARRLIGGTTPQSGQYYHSLMLTEGNAIIGLASDARASPPRPRTERIKNVTAGALVPRTIFDAFATRGVEGMNKEDLERLLTNTKLRWFDGKAVRPCFHHGWDGLV
jgi:hypothetical protein